MGHKCRCQVYEAYKAACLVGHLYSLEQSTSEVDHHLTPFSTPDVLTYTRPSVIDVEQSKWFAITIVGG